jgi:hypothetical protein
VPAGAAHAVQEVIDFVHQCFEQRTSRFFDVREQRPDGGRFSEADAGREGTDDLFAASAAILEDTRLIFDFATETEDAIGIAFEKTFLLLLEQAEKFAVFSEFLPETFSDALPVHIMSFPPSRQRS